MTESAKMMGRREFVGGTAAVAAGALAMGAGVAGAAESAKKDAVAPATADWLGEAPEVGKPDQVLDYDVVVVGAGTGGWFAACSAAEEGVRTLLLEKTEMGADVRGDLGAVNTRYQQEDGCVIDEAAMLFDMYRFSAGNSSHALHKTWFENSGEAVDWYGDRLEEAGIKLWHEMATEDPEKVPLAKHWPTGHSPEFVADADGNKPSGKTVLEAYFTSQGGEVMYQTAMLKLAQDASGAVTGVYAQDADGNVLQVNAAKGVILATGGYGRDEGMLAALQPATLGLYSLSIAKPGATGDGIRAALWAGAAMDDTHSSMLFDRCAIAADATTADGTPGSFFNMGSYPWLKVNLEGRRFANEGTGVYDWFMHAGEAQPQGTYCTIWDSDWIATAEKADMHGCCRFFPYENGAPANESVESITAQNEQLLADGVIQQADTVEELAEKLGLPADAFAQTVARYNELAEGGVDEDFGKEWFRMAPLATPPFFGVRNAAVMLCTLDGIRIDTDMRALRADGSAIEGLYVVGNDSGCYYSGSYINTSTGNAAGRTLTFGRRAGKNAAAR